MTRFDRGGGALMPNRDDDRIVTEFEWKLSLRLDAALTFRSAREKGKGDPTKMWDWPSRWAVDEFHRMALRGSDAELSVAATMFVAKAGRVPRPQRNTVLTLLARSVCDALPRRTPERESETSFFGRFVNELIEDHPIWHVEWAEDMRDGIPETGVEQQPIPVIRGVLFSSSIDVERMIGFWDRAATSERFPVEVFSEPCAPEEGVILSTLQCSRIGRLFSVMSESAAVSFATHLAGNALMMIVISCDERNNGFVRDRVEAPEKARIDVMRSVLGNVTPPSRRNVIADAFGLAA